MALTDTSIRAIKSLDKTTRHSDGGGLYLQVTPQGSRLWRMAFRFSNKQKTLAFGKYPVVTLAEARQKREHAKALLAKGVDPSDIARQKKQQKRIQSENNFGSIAMELLTKLEKEGKAGTTLKKKRWMLGLASSHLDHRAITEITATDILVPLKTVESKGSYETARRLRYKWDSFLTFNKMSGGRM